MSKDLIINIVNNILESTQAERIILFGSYAKGNAKKDSDLDLLIVKKNLFTKEHSRRKEILKIREALSKIRILKDILVYDVNEFDEWKNSTNHIVAKSLKEGKIIYER